MGEIEAVSQAQQLRPYQLDALDAIKAALDRGERTVCSMATGTGKSTVAAELLNRELDPFTQRALVLAHSQEIIYQLFSRIQKQMNGKLQEWYGMAPGIAIEMADQRAPDARIVVATRQSMHKKRLEQVIKYGLIDYLLIDESHHCAPDNSYDHILNYLTAVNPNLRVVGFSATPRRTDGKALKVAFDTICYEMSIIQGIASGWLVPPTRLVVGTGVNLSGVKTIAGDYNEKQLLSILEASNWCDLAVKAYNDHILPTARQTLAYFPKVSMSKEFTARLIESGVSAAHIDGETPKDIRAAILRAYGAGEIKIVSNYGVILEGLDVPETGAILLARPTRSQTLMSQITGRGLRLFPGKTDCLILDLTVMDTKVMLAGRLEGRMRRCKGCGVEFYDGFKKCPKCGKDAYDPTQQPLPMAGGGVVHTPAGAVMMGEAMRSSLGSLFDNLQASWIKNAQGAYIASLGFSQSNLIIIPPDFVESQEYSLYKVSDTGQGNKPVRTLIRSNADLASLMVEADLLVLKSVPKDMQNVVKKDAKWRDSGPSDKQVDFMKKLGIAVIEGMTKGQASDAITAALAMKRNSGI